MRRTGPPWKDHPYPPYPPQVRRVLRGIATVVVALVLVAWAVGLLIHFAVHGVGVGH